jgi:hypothetical protein
MPSILNEFEMNAAAAALCDWFASQDISPAAAAAIMCLIMRDIVAQKHMNGEMLRELVAVVLRECQ